MFDDETVMFKIYFEPFLQKSLFIFYLCFAQSEKLLKLIFNFSLALIFYSSVMLFWFLINVVLVS